MKKRDLVELVEEMVAQAPDKKMGQRGEKGKNHQDFMDKIMGTGEDKENDETKKGVRQRIKEDDIEDDGFEDWRQDILRRAVEEGFTKYKKHLAVTN